MTFVSLRAYLHARVFCSLTDTSFIPVCAMYLQARMFSTLTDVTFISMGGAMYLHAKKLCTL